MSRRRKSGVPTPNPATEPFAVRWHSIANPGTPSVDIMSSPDPLNDETTFLAPPSSQRVTRSSRSTRFASLGRSASPRKQQFELEVGDNRSPQRLLVTVETEDESAPPAGTRRRLFASSSPLKDGGGMMATTTTVPLKESIEDEFGNGSLTTPKKRGRPRKTNGTPIPSAAKKRRAPTPMKRTPKRVNTGRDVATSSVEPSQPTPTPRRRGRPPKNSVEPASDAGSQLEPTPDLMQMGTPTPKRRGRPPKNRSVDLTSDLGLGSQQKPSTTKDRRRRQALAPEDLEIMAEESEPVPERHDANDDDAMDLVGADANAGGNQEVAPSSAAGDHNSDIWMATMSDQETPRAMSRKSRSESAVSPTPARGAPIEQPLSDDMESVASRAEGFAEGAPSVSDAGSIMDGPYHSATRRNDTVAQEDFSMIFMDSIQSYQELRSSKQGPEPVQEEIGEETSHIIHNTLESLRQGAEVQDEDRKEDEPVAEGTTAGTVEEVAQDDNEDIDDAYGAEVDDMDLNDVPEDSVEPTPQEVQEQEALDLPDLPEVVAGFEHQGDAEQEVAEENMVAQSEAIVEDHAVSEDDVDMVQESTAEKVGELADESMEEHAVPELDDAAEFSSSPRQADEPDEPEVVQTSSPVRSAGLSSKFGASPWLSRTPRRPNVSPLRRQVLSSVVKSDMAPRLSQKYHDSPSGMAAGPSHTEASPRIAQDESNLYEDSFSEIPEVILAAATPGRTAPVATVEKQDHEDESEDAVAVAEERFQTDDHNREPEFEPADDEDASNAELDQAEEEEGAFEDQEEQQQQPPTGYAPASQEQPPAPSNASSLAPTDNGRLPTPDDTPPNIEMEADQHDKSTQASVASPTPDPQAQLASEHAAAPSSAQRSNASQAPRISVKEVSAAPEITPLNQMSSPVQNPPSTASQTSPEKVARPALSAIVRAGRVLQSVTSDPPSPGDRQKQLGSPFRSSASKESWSGSREPASQRPSASPGRRSTSHQRQSASIDKLNDDPFASKPDISRGQASFLQALGRSVGEDASKGKTPSAGPPADSVRFTPQHEEMSWLPDAEPAEPGSTHGQSHSEAAHSSPSRRAEKAAGPDPGRSESLEDRDDETDIWEIEAQRDEPESSRKETSFLSMTSAPLHRRPAIPSPWARKSEFAQRSTSHFAASKASNGISGTNQPHQDDDGEGYSLLAQRQKAQEVEAAKQPESTTKANGFDLSSFFSSPAAIGGKLAEKFFPSKFARQEEPEKAEAPVVPHNTMFPSAPQRDFEPSSEGRKDLSSPARSQGPQQSQSPSLRSQSQSQSNADQTQELEPSTQRRPMDASASPTTPERLEQPVSAQKRDFTPRPRQTSQSFFQPSTARSSALTPPRMQLSHEDIERWQQETSNASSDEANSPQRFLRPLPPRNASPSKSAIRSPMKPHTPGRVVEFTSSVLSPIEQARQRQQRRAIVQDEEDVEDMYQPVPARGLKKENGGENLSMADAPQTASNQPKKLSKTVWSRDHWLFMDKLLQHRKKQRFGIECEPRSQSFLGKTVWSHGESLKLEQWHLECVDAFKAIVGGWDERSLCMRLFSLIKSEEKRAREVAPDDVEMFH